MRITESDSYFRRREAQERELAEGAGSEAIRGIHLAMADRYQRLADEDENRVVPIGPPAAEA
jgi:hypothetical protein